jgi:neurotransmitter:Na+ symporter, NSS family
VADAGAVHPAAGDGGLRGHQTGDLGAAARYLFPPTLTGSGHAGEAILSAMGQAFFSLSLGMGAIMIYGSYLKSDASIMQNTVIIALLDTAVALLAGLAIFPIVFAHGLEPGSGPGLIFKTLPIAFGEMPGGAFFGALFFLLLVFAAWTSAISLLEPVVAWLVENRGFSRVRASVLAGRRCGCSASPACCPSTTGRATPSSARASWTSSTISPPTSCCPSAAS